MPSLRLSIILDKRMNTMTENIQSIRDIRDTLLAPTIGNAVLRHEGQQLLTNLRRHPRDIRVTGWENDKGEGRGYTGLHLNMEVDPDTSLGTTATTDRAAHNLMRLLYLAAMGAAYLDGQVEDGNNSERVHSLESENGELRDLLNDAYAVVMRATDRCETIRSTGPDVEEKIRDMRDQAEDFVREFHSLVEEDLDEISEATEGLCGDTDALRRIAGQIDNIL